MRRRPADLRRAVAVLATVPAYVARTAWRAWWLYVTVVVVLALIVGAIMSVFSSGSHRGYRPSVGPASRDCGAPPSAPPLFANRDGFDTMILFEHSVGVLTKVSCKELEKLSDKLVNLVVSLDRARGRELRPWVAAKERQLRAARKPVPRQGTAAYERLEVGVALQAIRDYLADPETTPVRALTGYVDAIRKGLDLPRARLQPISAQALRLTLERHFPRLTHEGLPALVDQAREAAEHPAER